MAMRQVFVDDISGSEDDVQTVRFAVGGVQYAIDLGSKNRERLDKALAEFVGHARREGGRARSGGQPARTDKAQLDAMRSWLRENGHEVSDRGRIAGNLQDLYNAAH